MPASHLIAGMARSYGCPAISFTDNWLTQKVSCIEGPKINHHRNQKQPLLSLSSCFQ